MRGMLLTLMGLLFIAFIILVSRNVDTSNALDPGLRSYNFEPRVEVGQTWVRIDSLNPFKSTRYDTFEVIDIKGRYAKVVWNGDTTSMETDLVNWRSKLLK